jgi:iron complex outermembrane recepter protein
MTARGLALTGCGLLAIATGAAAQTSDPNQAQPAQQQAAEGVQQDAADQGDEIIVTGVRGSLREAIEIERQADTVVSVITADDAGQFADQNVAESLQRVAGITIQRVEGEGRTIQIRGLNSNFNQVVLNGAQVGSSDPDGGRSVSLDIISADLLSGIRVAKTLTPDTDHDSLGAQVNLLTLSAFDRTGTTGRIRVEGGLAEYTDRISPKVTADFTTRLLDDTLGIALAGTYSKRYIQSEEVRSPSPNAADVTAAGAVSRRSFTDPQPPGTTRYLVPRIVDQRLKRNERERIGGTFQIDYRPDEDNRWSLAVIGAQLKDADTRIQNEWEVGQTTINAASTGFARYTTRLEQQIFFQDSTDRIWAGNFYGENRFGGLTFSYGADYSKNEFTLPDGLRGRYASGNNVPIEVEFDEDDARVTVLDLSRLAPSLLVYNQSLIIDETRSDEIWSAFGNLEAKFDLGGNEASVKIGGKYRDREKVIRRGELSQNPSSSSNRPLIDAAGIPRNQGTFTLNRPSNANFPGYFLFPSPDVVRPILERTAEVLALTARDVRRDFDFVEQTLAGYIQGQIDFGDRVTLIGGVRVERTDYVADGVIDETIERNGTTIRLGSQPAPTVERPQRTDWFPSLHLRADLTDQLVGRLSYSRGQVRPTFEDAKNLQIIDTTQQTVGGQLRTTERTVEIGNPFLDPLIADQFDATLGWYPSRFTSFTAAAFYKNLKNPFISAEFEGNDVTIIGLQPLDAVTGTGFSEAETTINGGSGKLYGVELGVNQFFRGALDGFFVTGNLTLIEGEARSPSIRDNAKLRLEDQANVIANLSVGYEDDRVTARVSGTYVGDRLESVDSSREELDTIRAPLLTVDVNLRFNMTDAVQLYADVTNLTNEKDYRYTRGIDGFGIVDRTSDYGRTFQLGAIVQF